MSPRKDSSANSNLISNALQNTLERLTPITLIKSSQTAYAIRNRVASEGKSNPEVQARRAVVPEACRALLSSSAALTHSRLWLERVCPRTFQYARSLSPRMGPQSPRGRQRSEKKGPSIVEMSY